MKTVVIILFNSKLYLILTQTFRHHESNFRALGSESTERSLYLIAGFSPANFSMTFTLMTNIKVIILNADRAQTPPEFEMVSRPRVISCTKFDIPNSHFCKYPGPD